MRNRFDTQLEQLSNRLICMGELCEKAIVNATLALRDGDLTLAKLVIREDEEVDHSFYTRSMDLSEHDFDFDEEAERKSSVKRGVLISIIVIVLLLIIAVVGYFILQHFNINIKDLLNFEI